MGRITPVCNAKNILGIPIGFSFHRIPPWLSLWKVDVCKLVSGRTNFVPPFRNIDQLLKIGIKYVFLYFLFWRKWFFWLQLYFLLKTYVITHTTKTYLPCSILKCFNQVYESNEKKTFSWTNTKLCRTQTSFHSLNCIYNMKAQMLNIFYRKKKNLK